MPACTDGGSDAPDRGMLEYRNRLTDEEWFKRESEKMEKQKRVDWNLNCPDHQEGATVRITLGRIARLWNRFWRWLTK